MGRYESIAKHLAPDFQAEFAAGRVNVSTAYELSTLPEEEQADALEEYRQRGALSLEDVRRRKAQEPEPVVEEAEQPTQIPEAAPSPSPQVQRAEERAPEKPRKEKREAEDTPEEKTKRLIDRLDSLCTYCLNMDRSGDKTRDWKLDGIALTSAIARLESTGGGAGCT